MVTCERCGRENPPDAQFCNTCGAPLGASTETARKERKVVSVLFADLVGFTSRAEQLDPEDVSALLTPYWQHLRDELERFGGTVEKFIGDAVMALFGAPASHEDDPERAVRAALAIRDWVRETGEDLQVRIAVNTGEALVLLGARPSEGEGMAAGDVVNTAARLQAAAPVNGVLVGEATYRATRHVVDYAEGDPVAAKGKSEPLRVWEAIAARSRATVERVSMGPLVGRLDEVDALLGALQRARRDVSPQLVTVAGVPGIGKSRLVAELYSAIEQEPDLTTWRRGRCLPYGDGVSLWALGEIVKAEAGVLESDDHATTSEKLDRSLDELVEDEIERAWLRRELAPLAGLDAAPGTRAESFAAWRRWVELLAERRPVVLVVEDLQWADDDLLDFVDVVAERVTGVPLLVVCTTRPELFERRPGWGGGKRNALTISLAPLEDADTARLIANVLERSVLDAATQHALLERAEGNPLYAEQYARMVAEGASPTALPETVQGIVAARLDLLSPEEKRLLQDASVVGRTFWPSALARSGVNDDLLFSLERKEFIRRERRSSLAGEQEYSFSHALVRDVAYAQIPRAERAERHRGAADWLETLPADRAEDRAEMVAHHYGAAIELSRASGGDAADLAPAARRAFGDAGDRALALNRLDAAARFYSAALDLAPDADAERGRLLVRRSFVRRQLIGEDAIADAQEAIAIFETIGDGDGLAEAELNAATAHWLAGKGVEASDHAERAVAHVREMGDTELKAEVLAEHARLLMLRGQTDAAVAIATDALALAERLGLERLQAGVLASRGAARADATDLKRGISIAERGTYVLELLRGLNNLAEEALRGADLGQVQELYDRMRAMSEEFGLTAQLRWTDDQEVWLSLERGDWDRALTLADKLIALADAGHADPMTPLMLGARAWIWEASGDGRAEADIARSLEAAADVGDAQAVVPTLATAARHYARHGRRSEGTQLLAEAARIIRDSGTTVYAWAPPTIWGFIELDAVDAYRELLARDRPSPWLDAAYALCDRDAVRAADIYQSFGALNAEAGARALAARVLLARGDRAAAQAQAAAAAAFFSSMGATARVAELDTMVAATA